MSRIVVCAGWLVGLSVVLCCPGRAAAQEPLHRVWPGLGVGSGGTAESCGTIGVPLVAEVMLTPFYVIGIGLQLFANINPEASHVGLFVTLPIGWMP